MKDGTILAYNPPRYDKGRWHEYDYYLCPTCASSRTWFHKHRNHWGGLPLRAGDFTADTRCGDCRVLLLAPVEGKGATHE